MKERARVAAVKAAFITVLDSALSGLTLIDPERVRTFPNQLVVILDGREYTITITENRKPRLR